MDDQTILWRRLDTSGHESARVYADDDGWYLDGSAIFLHEGVPCRLEYLIECDLEWQTTFASIDGWLGDEVIAYEIEVDEDRTWFVNGEEAPGVEGCADIDLNFSPITNLLPLRRLDLKNGEAKSVRAAWLRFPSFELEPLEQTYTRVDESTVEYASRNGEFFRSLKVNEAGLVIEYPDFWTAESVIAGQDD